MKEEIVSYHDEAYIDYICDYFKNPEKTKRIERFGVGVSADTPIFPKFFDFCQLISGSSILAGEILNHGKHDVVINWMGGYHHAKRSRASGFCYVNDIVLGILRLLDQYDRVMYVDIDVHHGDGVEEAFASCDRVLTLSMHQYDETTKFFPGTGNFDDIGKDEGIYTAINVPLRPGCDSDSFKYIFEKVFDRACRAFRPSAIWMQCGADSLSEDIIGSFRVGTKGHGECVRKVLSMKLPTVLCGGGGYKIENVARCWAYETSIALNEELPEKLPSNLYFQDYYSSNSNLHVIEAARKENNGEVYWRQRENKNFAIYNDKVYPDKVINNVYANISKLEASVQSRVSLRSQVDPSLAKYVKI